MQQIYCNDSKKSIESNELNWSERHLFYGLDTSQRSKDIWENLTSL